MKYVIDTSCRCPYWEAAFSDQVQIVHRLAKRQISQMKLTDDDVVFAHMTDFYAFVPPSTCDTVCSFVKHILKCSAKSKRWPLFVIYSGDGIKATNKKTLVENYVAGPLKDYPKERLGCLTSRIFPTPPDADWLKSRIIKALGE